MNDFIYSLESLQKTTYWSGVVISLVEITFLLFLFFIILYRVFKRKLKEEDSQLYLFKAVLISIFSFSFLFVFLFILYFNLNKIEVINNDTEVIDNREYRFIEKLNGDFEKNYLIDDKIDESELSDGFTYKINKYGEYYEVPIHKDLFYDVEFEKNYDLCVSRAFIEDLDTNDATVYITISNLGNICIRDFKVKVVYSNEKFSNLKECINIEELNPLDSKLIKVKIDTNKINRVKGASLKAVIEYNKDSNEENNILDISYFK